jgi:hypothetical protein
MNAVTMALVSTLVVSLATSARAQDVPASADSRVTHTLIAGYMVAAYVDASSTAWCLGKGTCTETNPLFRPIVNRHGVVPAMAVKGITHTAIAWWLIKTHTHHPSLARWSAVALLSAQVLVDVHNVRALRRAGDSR